MRKPIIAGNWKMNLTLQEAQSLVFQLKSLCDEKSSVDVVICPPFTALSALAPALRGSSIGLGAQDMFWEAQGAFTGEVSPVMLRDAGCQFVIIGHSERRTYFGETDESVQRKLSAAIANGLIPIVCMGETLIQREAQETFDVLSKQLSGAFAGNALLDYSRIIIAYEPVWAIGTGKNATPQQAQEAHAFIRQWIVKHLNAKLGEEIRLQYGGSVTPANASSILQQSDVDGALVGGASLKAESFIAIIKAATESKSLAKR